VHSRELCHDVRIPYRRTSVQHRAPTSSPKQTRNFTVRHSSAEEDPDEAFRDHLGAVLHREQQIGPSVTRLASLQSG
jgi:hypothetical protein